MIDPPRLSNDNGDPFERELLWSARRDHGSNAARTRCIVAATTAAVVATHGVAGAATTASATTAVASAVSVGTGFVVKAIAIGFAIGLGAQGVIAVKHHAELPTAAQRLETNPTASKHAAGHAKPETLSVAPLATEEAPAVPTRNALANAADANARLPNAATSGPRAATPNRVTPAEASTEIKLLEEPAADFPISVKRDDSLEREVALLDEARRFALAKGYDRTFLLLERYQRDFPQGELGPEALVIRVQALLGVGRRAEAEALARPFIARYPHSPVTTRLTALLAESPQMR